LLKRWSTETTDKPVWAPSGFNMQMEEIGGGCEPALVALFQRGAREGSRLHS